MTKRWSGTILAWLLAITGCAWLVFKTPITTDLSLFIPATDASVSVLNELRTGPATRLILMGVEGGSEQDRAFTNERLGAQLRQSGLFAWVANGTGFLTSDEQRKLFSYRYLLSPTVVRERFSAAALHAALLQRLRELSSPLSALEKRFLPADPTAEWLTLLQTWQGDKHPEKRYGVWFSPDGARSLLVAETGVGGFDLDAQERSVKTIRESFDATRTDANLKLLLSGPAVFAVMARDTIRFEASILSIAASILVGLILIVSYRSPRLVVLSILPLGAGVLAAVAAVYLLFGQLYGITLAFGVTLLGVAVDYPIHFFTHLHPDETVESSLERIWSPLLLGAITTALGCLAMVSADFPGLAQLGVFAIAGLLAAVACTRWLLPALLPPVWAPRRCAAGGDWAKPLFSIGRYVGVMLSVLSVVAAVALLSITPPLWNDDLAALSPIPAQAITLDRELRTILRAPEPSHMLVVTAADAETALQRSEAVTKRLENLIEERVLTGFESAARYVPSQRVQRERQAALPERQELERNLNAALVDLPFKPDLFQPFLEAVTATRQSSLLSPQDLAGTALGLRVSSLLFQNGAGSGWTAVLPLVGVADPTRLMQAFQNQRDGSVSYLNLKAETERLVARFRDEALVRMSWGAVLIVIVLWLGLRFPRRVLAVLLPVALAIGLDLAMLLALGQRLSLFHLVSLLLVLGIGIDYSLFFSLPEADAQMRGRTLYAVLVCSGSTLAVFGMLALSRLPVLNAIGQTVSIGVVSSFFMALALAPQLSRSWRVD